MVHKKQDQQHQQLQQNLGHVTYSELILFDFCILGYMVINLMKVDNNKL